MVCGSTFMSSTLQFNLLYCIVATMLPLLFTVLSSPHLTLLTYPTFHALLLYSLPICSPLLPSPHLCLSMCTCNAEITRHLFEVCGLQVEQKKVRVTRRILLHHSIYCCWSGVNWSTIALPSDSQLRQAFWNIGKQGKDSITMLHLWSTTIPTSA